MEHPPVKLPNDTREAFKEIASYLRSVRKDRPHYERVDAATSELVGHVQTPEWIDGLLELASECERLAGAPPSVPQEQEKWENLDGITLRFGTGKTVQILERLVTQTVVEEHNASIDRLTAPADADSEEKEPLSDHADTVIQKALPGVFWQVETDAQGYQKLVCNCEDVTDEIGHSSKTDLGPIADAHNGALTALYADLKEIENHCPCGARPESLKTHPHVGGCPVERALRRFKARSVALDGKPGDASGIPKGNGEPLAINTHALQNALKDLRQVALTLPTDWFYEHNRRASHAVSNAVEAIEQILSECGGSSDASFKQNENSGK
jgi:hypothetical protein